MRAAVDDSHATRAKDGDDIISFGNTIAGTERFYYSDALMLAVLRLSIFFRANQAPANGSGLELFFRRRRFHQKPKAEQPRLATMD